MADGEIRFSARLSVQSSRPPAKVPGYEQEVFIGRGAFGEVWKAINSNNGRAVAIKFYSHRGGLDWSHMAREVEKLQYLFADRYVVQLFDIGWDADPPYYVMEYMGQGSLEDRLRKQSISVTEAVRIIREIARGLVHAHDRGILHCDLKPSNILLDQDGSPRLADFGQSRLKHERAPALGTLFYMAPEQADLSATPDARWDVYALGTILYRMVSGELPYSSESLTTSVASSGPIEERLRSYVQLLHKSPRPNAHRRIPGVDKFLARVIEGCLALDPKHRFRNVQSVLFALDQRETKRAQRPLLLLGLLGPALVVLVMTLVGGYLLDSTLTAATDELLDRTVESDRFAAKSVAGRLALEVDKRWHFMEQEAGRRKVQEWLADERQPADRREADRPFQQWIDERRNFWNQHFSPQTASAYWFILDRQGRLRAISPNDESLLGTYFGYRDYFHGQGRELPRDAPPPAPITESYRSNVFRSQPTNRPAIGLSVPIFDLEKESNEPPVLGVLVMETELGHFADFAGSRCQFAALVDLRPDENGKRGLLVEHPELTAQTAQHAPVGQYYVTGDVLAVLDALRQHPSTADESNATASAAGETSTSSLSPARSSVIIPYRDPVGGAFAGDWLAAAEPVFVFRSADSVYDSGWAVLIQERHEDTLRPLARVRSLIVNGGAIALGLVALVIAGLWGIVVLLARAPQRAKSLGFWNRSLPTTSPRSESASMSPPSEQSSPGGN